MNETAGGGCSGSSAGTVALGVGLCVVAVVNLAGNLLTIAAFATDRSLRQKPTNLLLLSLSCGDLLVGLSIPIRVSESICEAWLFGVGVCQFQTFYIDIGVVVGFLSLSSIALDRYLLISREYPRYVALQSRHNVLRSIAVVWAISIGIAVLEIVIWNAVEWDADFERRCYSPPRNNPVFALSVFVITFLVPIVLIVGLSLRFLVLLKRRLAKMRSPAVEELRAARSQVPVAASSSAPDSKQETALTNVGDGESGEVQESPVRRQGDADASRSKAGRSNGHEAASGSASAQQREQMRSRYVRPAIIMISLVTTFMICTLPYMVYISLAIRICPACDDELVRFHLINVLFLNSTINPFLYAATHPKIRAFHLRLFGAILCRLRRSRHK